MTNGTEQELRKFGPESTAMEVVANCDLRGKFAIVTGANRGIGLETAKALASRGCTVIFGCRDLVKANAAITNLKKQNFSAQCDPIHLDLSSLESVRHFVEEYMSKYETRPLHYLVLNAAVFPAQHQTTADGYELAYQTHISNFFLVRLLADKLVMSAPARIVVLSCAAVQLATEDTFSEKCLSEDFFSGLIPVGPEWMSETVYANSKVLNVLFAAKLSRQLSEKKVFVFVAQPNKVRTNLYQQDVWKHMTTQLSLLGAQSAEQAAATSTLCCVQAGLERYNGCCFTDCQVVCQPKWMQNEVLLNRLWVASEKAISRTLASGASAESPQPKSNIRILVGSASTEAVANKNNHNTDERKPRQERLMSAAVLEVPKTPEKIREERSGSFTSSAKPGRRYSTTAAFLPKK